MTDRLMWTIHITAMNNRIFSWHTDLLPQRLPDCALELLISVLDFGKDEVGSSNLPSSSRKTRFSKENRAFLQLIDTNASFSVFKGLSKGLRWPQK